MVDGPGPCAIGDDLPIMPLVAGPVWDELQIAGDYDIWGTHHAEGIDGGADAFSNITRIAYASAKSFACANSDSTDFCNRRVFMRVNSWKSLAWLSSRA